MTVTTSGVVNLRCFVEQGVGFINHFDDLMLNSDHFLLENPNVLPLNTNFNPVIEANYALQDRVVETVRANDVMQLAVWDITTDGTILPVDALFKSVTIACSIFTEMATSFHLLAENIDVETQQLRPKSIQHKESAKTVELPTPIFYTLIDLKIETTKQTLKNCRRFLRNANSIIIKRPTKSI
jgi:DNA-directed RNA polymerase alpha subunit